jgi:hypothetical protein
VIGLAFIRDNLPDAVEKHDTRRNWRIGFE